MVKVYVVTVSFDNGATWAEDDMSWRDVIGIYFSMDDAIEAQNKEFNLCTETLNERQMEIETSSYTESSEFGHNVLTRTIRWDLDTWNINTCKIRVHTMPIGDLPDGLFKDYNPESYRYF